MVTRLVVIDDEPQYLELIKEFAQMIGCKALGFDSLSREAKQALNEDTLLFLDIHMPTEDGIDILMKLDVIKYSGGVVVLSGADSGVIDSVLRLGNELETNVLGHLPKPFTLSAFQQIVHRFKTGQATSKSDKQANHIANMAIHDLKEWFENGYIFPVYQPQINPISEDMVGFECLVRLDHPELGSVAPPILIDHLVETKQINTFTQLLMERAFDDCACTLQDNPSLKISFNICADSLDQEFTDSMLQRIDLANIRHSQVTIEVTETRAITLSKDALYAVSKYRAAGVNLSIDDFGTGYSSIAQLNELPFNELKIDRSFISNILTHKKAFNIVQATISLANALSLDVVVEGVETNQQRKLVCDLGCTAIQGFYYSKPLRLNDFLDYLKKTGAQPLLAHESN